MKLNLCSGPNLFVPPWLNIDRVDQSEYIRILREDVPPEMAAQWPEHQRRLVEHLRAGGKIDFRVHDVREPLAMFADGSIDAIYLGQCIEHWNRQRETVNILIECYTLLKPGGVLRITTPDLDKIFEAYDFGTLSQFDDEQPSYYAKALEADKLSYILFGATGPDCTVENYEGHFHIYSRGTIAAVLTEAGFSGPYSFGPPSEAFADVVDMGESHSLFVEAVKE